MRIRIYIISEADGHEVNTAVVTRRAFALHHLPDVIVKEAEASLGETFYSEDGSVSIMVDDLVISPEDVYTA